MSITDLALCILIKHLPQTELPLSSSPRRLSGTAIACRPAMAPTANNLPGWVEGPPFHAHPLSFQIAPLVIFL